jgi:drug/metabolite transporter (DMT)-like permease
MIDKKKPDVYNIAAAIITIAGIGLVSLNGNFTIRMGDMFTLAGGAAYAFHLVAVAKFGKDKDPILLTILQFAYSAVFAWIVALLFEDFPTEWSADTITGLMYLAVLATAVALLLQNVGQKYTNPAPASIILSLESVFGVLFSIVFYHEQITLKVFFGFVFIFMAVILSETKLSFLKNQKKVRLNTGDNFE